MDLRLITLIILVAAAALRSEVFFYLLYVLVGLQLLAWLWVRATARAVRWSRSTPTAAFPDEPIEVTLAVRNQGLLPIPWLMLHENLPAALHNPPSIRQVIGLGAHHEHRLAYTLVGRRRGLYRLGPLTMRTGDVLGLFERPLEAAAADTLVIYPRVLPLAELGLPAALPFGARPAPASLFTDPARPTGARPYAPGDSVRQIDWKNSARSGALQVRRHEPAIARETMIALAFSLSEYPGRYTYDDLERAVVAAASLAADLLGRGQPVGLCTSGHDPLRESPEGASATITPAAGRGHLVEILRLLGRLEHAPEGDVVPILERAAASLGWGSTIVVITYGADATLVRRLVPMRRRGLHVALVLVEGSADELALARSQGIPTYFVSRTGAPVEV
jgi:uncharacterized protein (DUF58 family)